MEYGNVNFMLITVLECNWLLIWFPCLKRQSAAPLVLWDIARFRTLVSFSSTVMPAYYSNTDIFQYYLFLVDNISQHHLQFYPVNKMANIIVIGSLLGEMEII